VGAEAGALFGGGVFGEGDEGRREGFGGLGKMGSALAVVRRRGENFAEGEGGMRGSSRRGLRDQDPLRSLPLTYSHH
jgi:hypothetical protein